MSSSELTLTYVLLDGCATCCAQYAGSCEKHAAKHIALAPVHVHPALLLRMPAADRRVVLRHHVSQAAGDDGSQVGALAAAAVTRAALHHMLQGYGCGSHRLLPPSVRQHAHTLVEIRVDKMCICLNRALVDMPLSQMLLTLRTENADVKQQMTVSKYIA